MKISKNGLWYNLHKNWPTSEYSDLCRGYQVSLCPWFWKGCGVLAVFAAVVTFLLGLVLGALSSLFTLLISPYTGIWQPDTIVVLGFAITGIALLLFTGFGATELLPKSFKGEIPWIPTYIYKYFPEWKAKEKKYRKMSKPKQPNILVEYIKAKKSKWCPLLELEEDEN
jgi:hypothetical protein